jgi:hypothetical protein
MINVGNDGEIAYVGWIRQVAVPLSREEEARASA